MRFEIKRYYALLSTGHLLLVGAILLCTLVISILSFVQKGNVALAIECGIGILLFTAALLPLAYTSRLEIDPEGAVVFDRGTLLSFNIGMRRAIKDSCRMTTLTSFRFEQNALEKKINVGRLILSGEGEIDFLDGHREKEVVSDLVIYGITDFERFKQSFVDELNSKP